MRHPGFIIAKPGKDALKANPEDDYVTTKYPLLKVIKKGKGVVAMTAAEATGTGIIVNIPHGLSYKPLTQAFGERQPGGNFRIILSTNQVITNDVIYIISWVDDTNLVMRFTGLGSDPTGSYKYSYYIFGDEAEVDT